MGRYDPCVKYCFFTFFAVRVTVFNCWYFWGMWYYLAVIFLVCYFNCHQVDVKKATPKPDGIGGLRGGRGARGGRGRGRGGRDSRVKGKGEQAGVPWKTTCFKLCTVSCVFF
jgi:hypothetical protein